MDYPKNHGNRHKKIREMCRFLYMHEDFDNRNMMPIFLVTNKVHENEHQCISKCSDYRNLCTTKRQI
jgi:hypothetical protein